MAITRFGFAADRNTWSRLLDVAGEQLSHRLWRAVIREIASAVLERDDPDLFHAAEDDGGQEELLSDWMHDALPVSADLALILGELDYFRDRGLAWDEEISLSGDACGCPLDVVDDLRAKLDGYPWESAEAITTEVVEMFYAEWRTRFLQRVLKEARNLVPEEVVEVSKPKQPRPEEPAEAVENDDPM